MAKYVSQIKIHTIMKTIANENKICSKFPASDFCQINSGILRQTLMQNQREYCKNTIY